MTKKSYEVRSPLHHDGREFAIGKRVELGDDEAAPLVAAGVVAAVPDAPGEEEGELPGDIPEGAAVAAVPDAVEDEAKKPAKKKQGANK